MVKRCYRLFFLIFISANLNCADDSDDKLTFTRTPYDGHALRFDGYYYRTFTDRDIEIYFLFRNGNLLFGGGVSPANLQWMEEMFKNGKYYEIVKNDKTMWGIFKVDGTTIVYERWVPANGMGATPACRYTGTILNDTTFQMHSYSRVDGTDQNAYEYTFKFKQFSPKPDSVTQFIP